MKTALVCGGGGFIGGHLINRLKKEGYFVRGVDLKENEYGNDKADEFFQKLSSDTRQPSDADGKKPQPWFGANRDDLSLRKLNSARYLPL